MLSRERAKWIVWRMDGSNSITEGLQIRSHLSAVHGLLIQNISVVKGPTRAGEYMAIHAVIMFTYTHYLCNVLAG